MFAAAILSAYVVLAVAGVKIVGYFSRRADDFEQVRLSPWLANFDEYCRHAVDEGFCPIKPDEDRTTYIRAVEGHASCGRGAYGGDYNLF